MEAPKFLERLVEKTPGLGYVVGVAFILPYVTVVAKGLADILDALLRPHSVMDVFHESAKRVAEMHERVASWSIPLIIACYVLYRAGSFWDNFLFNPLYSLPDPKRSSADASRKNLKRKRRRKWFYPLKRLTDHWFPSLNGRLLVGTRIRAQEKMRRYPHEYYGIYSRAKQMLDGSDEWEREVNFSLQFSKFARTFLWPLLAFFLCALMASFLRISQVIPVGFVMVLGSWWFVLSCAALFFALTETYLALRIRHLIAMYRLISEKALWFSVSTETDQPCRMLCFGRTAYPESSLNT